MLVFVVMLGAFSRARAQTATNDCLTVICPPDLVTNYVCDPTQTYTPSQYPLVVSNNCPNASPTAVSVMCNPPAGTPLPMGVNPIHCQVMMNGAVAAVCDFRIIVLRDDTPPKIVCPTNILVAACPSPTGGCGTAVVYPPPAATDNSGSVAVTCTPASGSFFFCGTNTVTCLAQDRCGNKSECSFLVIVRPTDAPPQIHCPPDMKVETCSNSVVVNYPFPSGTPVVCNPPSGSVFPIGTTTVTCVASNGCGSAECSFRVTVAPTTPVTIQCSVPTTVFTVPCGSNCVPVFYSPPTVGNGALEGCVPPSGSCLPPGVHVVVCRATNACTKAACQFEVQVIQGSGQRPSIVCPSNIVVRACDTANGCQVVNYPAPSVVGGALVGCNPPPGTCFPFGTTIVTCRATNVCGSDDCTFTVTVQPVPPPAIQCPTNLTATVPCGSNCVPVFYASPFVTSGALVNCTPPSGTCFAPGIYPVVCRATNICGQAVGCTFEVTVLQGAGQPPSIHCPSNIVVRACDTANACAIVNYPAPIVSNGVLVGCNPPSGFCFPFGSTTVTCRATNLCSKDDCTFTVTVQPVPPPAIQCPTNLVATVPCGSNCVPVFYPAPAVVNGSLLACTPPSGTCFAPGVYPVVCRATNICGLAVGCTFDLTVLQGAGQPPSIRCPSNIVVRACDTSNGCQIVNYPLPTVSNGVFVGCNPPSGSCFPFGNTVVTCRATNLCSKDECTFTVSVQPVPPPSIQCPTNLITAYVPCGSNCVRVFYPSPVVANGSLLACTPPSGTCFTPGVYIVTCRATNICGQAAGCEFDIRVLKEDGKPPGIQCPGDITVDTCSNATVVFYPAPAVTPPGTSVICTPPSGSVFPLGTTAVTCVASNGCGSTSCSFKVTVQKGDAVSIQCPTNTIVATVRCGSNCVPVFYPPPFVSNGALVSCNPPSGTCLGVGSHLVTCRATNACGSSAVCEFKVEVIQGPGDLPHIECSSNIVVNSCSAAGACQIVNYSLPIVFSGGLVGCTPPPGTCFPIGTTVVNCVATNACGSNECKFTVTVRPTPPPVIRCPTNPIIVTAPCGSNCVPVNYTLPGVTNGVLVACNPPPGTCLTPGIYFVVCQATNICGQGTACEFQVRVVPGQGIPPAINCPSNIVVETCNTACQVVNYPLPAVLNGSLRGCTPPSGTCFPIGTTPVVCVATNGCGSNSCTFTVTVRPVPPPTIQCPTNIITVIAPCGSNCVPVVDPFPVVSAGSIPICNPPSGTCLSPGVYLVTCHATNKCGQTASCEFEVRVIPGQGIPPTINCPSNIVVNTCSQTCQVVTYPLPTVFNGSLRGCNPPSGTCFPVGVNPVTCVATNGCGSNACTFNVIVRTTPFPQLHCPSNIVVSTCGSGEYVNYPLPLSTATAPVTCTPPPGSFFPVGTNRVTCCVTDSCHRTNCCDFVIVVRPGNPCIKPPVGMVLWLPFDEPAGVFAANNIPGAPNGLHLNGPAPVLGSYVMNSRFFDGLNDFTRVPNYAAIMLNASDLSIDAWVLRGAGSGLQGRQVIVSKIGQVFGAPGARGYEYYLNNGVMNLLLDGVVAQNFNSGIVVPLDNNWHHVAVTVQRGGGGAVRFYLDGGLVAAQFGPITLPLGNNSALYVGASTFPGATAFFRGALDEIEIFRRVLTPGEVFGLWNARQSGKCKISCSIPPVVTFPPYAACVTIQAQICNNSGLPQTITWVAQSGLVMPVPSGSITLPPFTCTNVPIQFCRTNSQPFLAYPWSLSLFNGTQCPVVCNGWIIDVGIVVVNLPNDPVLVTGTNRTIKVPYDVSGLPPGTATRLVVVNPDMDLDTQFVRLNGLPPGTPFIDRGGAAKALDKALPEVDVAFSDMDPIGTYAVVLEADLDGDGEFETPLGSFSVQNPVVAPPTLRIENGQLWWDDNGDGIGSLESADSLDGPWAPAEGGPGTPIDKSGTMKFYRIAVPAE